MPLLSPSQPCRLDTASHQAEEDGQKLHSSARAAGTKHQGPGGLNKGNLFLTVPEGEVQGPGASGQQRRRPRVLPLHPSVPAHRLLQGCVTWAVGPPR